MYSTTAKCMRCPCWFLISIFPLQHKNRQPVLPAVAKKRDVAVIPTLLGHHIVQLLCWMLLMHVLGTDVTSQYWICALELGVVTKPLRHLYKDLYFVTQANVMASNLTL